jgi:hypothetical protein
MAEQTRPPGWDADELSRFIDLAQNNELATFANKRKAYKLPHHIDSIYQGLAENLINTKEIVPSLLYLRSHSAYRASCRLSIAVKSLSHLLWLPVALSMPYMPIIIFMQNLAA